MSKLGLNFVPCTLISTKKSLDKYSSVHPTYLPKSLDICESIFGLSTTQSIPKPLNLALYLKKSTVKNLVRGRS